MLNSSYFLNSSCNQDLIKIIEKDLDAKAAYNALKDCNNKKKDAARTKLCAAIIKYELAKNSVMRQVINY